MKMMWNIMTLILVLQVFIVGWCWVNEMRIEKIIKLTGIDRRDVSIIEMIKNTLKGKKNEIADSGSDES